MFRSEWGHGYFGARRDEGMVGGRGNGLQLIWLIGMK
jgi:hypothetical protein